VIAWAASKYLPFEYSGMKPGMRKFLLSSVIGLPLLLILLSAAGYYLLHQPDFVKSQLQRRLAAATGWDLQIAGELVLDWGKTSVIEAHELHLTNPQWPQAPELFTAAGLRLQFQPLELFSGKLDMQDLRMQDCRARLHRDAAGKSNWSLAGKADPDPTQDAADPVFSWNLSRLEIQSCALQVHSDAQPQPLEARLDQALLQVDEQQVLTASIDGALDRQPLKLQGHLSPLPALWQGGDMQHAIDLQAGEIHLHSEGSVKDLYSGEEGDLSFHFSGPEFSIITRWLALPEFSQGEFDADITVHRKDASGNLLIGINADLGSLEIQGSGELDNLHTPSRGKAGLQIKGPDLEALGRTFGLPGLLAQPFDASFSVAIENSVTQLENLHITTGADWLQASGVLGPWPELKGSAVDIELHSVDLAAWLEKIPEQPLRVGSLDSKLKIVKDQQSKVQLDAGGELGHPGSAARQKFALGTRFLRQQQAVQLEQFNLQLGPNTLGVSGVLQLAQGLTGSQISAELKLDDLASSGRLLGLDLRDLPARPLHLQALLGWPGRGLKFTVSANETPELKLRLQGEIPDLENLLAMNAQFDVQLPSLRLAQFVLPDQDLPDLPFSARGQVSHDAQKQRTRVQDADLKLGQTTAKLRADLQLQKQLEGSTASWNVHSPDWRELWPAAPAGLESGKISSTGEWRRSAGADVFNSLKISSPLAELSGSGQILAAAQNPGAADKGRAMKFSLDIRGDNAARLNPFVGQLFDSQPFALQLTAAMDSGRFSSQDIHFQQARTNLTAELDVLLADRPVIHSKLRSALLDLTPLQQHFLATRTAQPAAKTPAQKFLFTDQPINLVGDVPFDLTLDLAVDELLFGPNQFRKVSFKLNLLPQSLGLQEFEFQGVRDGHYAGLFSAERQADGTALKLTARATNLRLGLIGVSGQDPGSLPPSDIQLDVTGKGSTWRELAQTLTGRTRWYTGSGRVSNAGLDFLFSDLMSQIFRTLNPLSHKSQFTQLNCLVYAAEMLDGQVKMAPIVIQTDQITAFSEGKVDLSSEAVDMSFRTVPRKGLGISAGAVVNPFFRIGGTLMKPALQLDVTKGAISGGAMVATAGLSVLFKSLSDRLLGSRDPCGDAKADIEANDQAAGQAAAPG
jgi:uncharacterized protein involved in outer membrane biogenesis